MATPEESRQVWDTQTPAAQVSIPTVIPMNQLAREHVLTLQTYLNNNGYPCTVDGVYGPSTAQALHAFQQANGIDVSDSYTVPLANYVLGGAAPTMGSGTQPVTSPLDAITQTVLSTATGAPQMTSSDIEAIRREYPEFSYYIGHPELGPVLVDAVNENLDPTQLWSRLTGTNWWRERSGSARQWESLVMVDPAEADRKRGTRNLNVASMASRMGIELTAEQQRSIVEHSLMWAWSDDEIIAVLGQVARNQPQSATRGVLGSVATRLRKLASDYLIPVSDTDIREWSIRIQEGTQTEDTFEQWIRGQSKSRFTWMAEDIDKGVTPSQYFSPVKTTVAQMLEMNDQDIDLSDPRWSDLLDYVDSNGVMRAMTLTEARQWARQQPEWDRTDNARQAASDMMIGLGNLFGRV